MNVPYGSEVNPRCTRRSLLKWSLAGAVGTLASPMNALAEALAAGGHRTEKALAVYHRLRGPMASITPSFTEDFALDEDSLRRWMDFMCEQQMPVVFFTFGDGEIDALSEEEIGRINLIAAERAKGTRTLVVGATGPWWTGRTADFVKRMEDGGLEAINIHFSPTIHDEKMVMPALEQIAARTEIPLLVYDDGNWPTSLITRTADISQVAGVKSHGAIYPFYMQAHETLDMRFAVLGPGQMKQFLYGAQVGSPAYLCPIAPVAPRVSLAFYEAVMAQRWDEAQRIVAEDEVELLKLTIPLGYPQAYKALAHLAGFYATPNVRPPRLSPTVEAMAPLKAFLTEKGWIS